MISIRPARHSPVLCDLIREIVGEPSRGIEIGVEKGRTSKMLLKSFPRLELICIDPWKPLEGNSRIKRRAVEFIQSPEYDGRPRHYEHAIRSQERHHEIRDFAFAVLKPFGDRVKILEMTSGEAASDPLVREGRHDFIFIDGDHANATADIEKYWPLVMDGGLLCGHDYGSFMSRGKLWDVDRAVNDLVNKTGKDLILRSFKIWGVVK